MEKITKEDIAKILSETITFTGQVGVINIHQAVISIDNLIKDKVAMIMDDITRGSSEHIQTGGLRFNGISSEALAVIFKKHGYQEKILF